MVIFLFVEHAPRINLGSYKGFGDVYRVQVKGLPGT